MPTVLVTGIAGGLAREVAAQLRARGADVAGVDYRELAGPVPRGVRLHRAQYHKTAIDDVLRKETPETVLHLGRVGNLAERMDTRFDLNVVGSQRLFDLCLQHGVKNLVVLSTFHVYGAHPRNHTPIAEADPLRAGPDFPQLADAIQLDQMAQLWAFKNPEVRTVVLRPTNVVGPSLGNTMTHLLRRGRVPRLLGFDPMTQFVHAADLARAVIAAMDGGGRGAFNVAGPTALPWSLAIDLAGARPLIVPSKLVTLWVRTMTELPAYLIEFLKYPCVITDRAFRREFGWEPTIDIRDTLASVRSTGGTTT